MKFHKDDQYINDIGDVITILSVEGDIVVYKMSSGNCFKSAKFFTEKMLKDNNYVKVVKEDEEDI